MYSEYTQNSYILYILPYSSAFTILLYWLRFGSIVIAENI
jgi:hypothetical protein